MPCHIGFLTLVEELSIRYEMAEECADDDDAKDWIKELRKAVLKELELHKSYCNVSINI